MIKQEKPPKTQSLFLVIAANNTTTDLDVSDPLPNEEAAKQKLRNEYEEARDRIFDGNDPGEFDTDDLSELGFSVYSAKTNDMEYGGIYCLQIPVPEQPAPVPSRAARLAKANLAAEDHFERGRSLSRSLLQFVVNNLPVLEVQGSGMLKAIRDNDLDAFVKALTGWNCEQLMCSAHIIRDVRSIFGSDPQDAKLVYQVEGAFYSANCKVDLSTHRVFDIHHPGEEGRFKLEDSEEIRMNPNIWVRLKEYGSFRVVSKEQMEKDQDEIVFWYGKEEDK